MVRDGYIAEILLVEDNPGDVLLTQTSMEYAKLANPMRVVSCGDEALAYLRKEGRFVGAETPGLVLLDLNLPGKDGREVLAELKADAALRVIPVVILTSSQDEGDIMLSYQNHANSYIVKPVEIDKLVKVVSVLDSYWMDVVTVPPR
jgi:two-component system, chemotaxis family, response regulator Rcp1